jgi:hypothetical protein
MGGDRSMTIQYANPLLELSRALPGSAQADLPPNFSRGFMGRIHSSDEALPLSARDRRRSKEGEQNRGNLVARERYIADPTQFERLFSKTYRAA